MIIVQNHIPVDPEMSKDFEERFSNTNENMKHRKGFIKNEILRPVKADSYVVLTYWQTMEDFREWADSDDFKKAHSRKPTPGMITGESKLTIHEVVEH
ncbi:MAG: antibiotic biosynthesis monooxygenase family protein [Thermoplasmataceae archaeon]